LSKLFRGSIADAAVLQRQAPLPETADELCEVARQLGADARDVHLGERATEGSIKKLNATNGLAGYRTVHFATHGLLAGEAETLGSGAEPALLLTPPSAASATDDGLLTASEVAQLKLDAEWVVLSACNTASADKGGGEALSGLARAFFYAGARALLVSHWYVDSDAAVKLVTGAFSALQRDPAIGRAEAMRRAVLSVMADQSRAAPSVPAAHPSVWGPFAVVGEGGSAP
jgi:CHAT domain-containing protein